MDLHPGDEIDRYVVERLVGRGGTADVYAVRHRALGGAFALRVAHDAQRGLREEGRLLASLHHPNVVAVYDLLEVGGRPALVTELVQGPSLARMLEGGPLPLPMVDELARGVLKGVRAAHLHGLVPRDLSAANVLLAEPAYPRSDDGWVPKIAEVGPGRPDERAEVHALGVLLYELCAGCPPEADEVPLDALVPSLPERIVSTVARAMAVEPSDRFVSVEELLDGWLGAVDATVWQQGLFHRPEADETAATLVDLVRPTAPSSDLEPMTPSAPVA
ncbi:MAG: serine/threonine-protein kinase, partial [Myxococcota bacterium]